MDCLDGVSWGLPPTLLPLPKEKKGLGYPAQVTVTVGQGRGQGWGGQQGRTFHVSLLKGSHLGREGQWQGGLGGGKVMQGGPAVGLGGGGVGRQALLFPSYDRRARGGAGAEGPDPWPSVR